VTTKSRAVFGAILIAVAAIGIAGTFFPSKVFHVLPFRSLGSPDEDVILVETDRQLLTAGRSAFRRSQVSLKYFTSMLEDETKSIELTYTASHGYPVDDPPGTVSDVSSSSEEIILRYQGVRFSLISSGFKIDPSQSLQKNEGTHLPIVEIWTVTPIAMGERDLWLKVEDPVDSRQLSDILPVSQTAIINGEPVSSNSNGLYKLPISVKNYWGVTQRAAATITGMIALLGFIFAYPLAVDLLKNLIKPTSEYT
jgi:hypothetical protein